MEHARLEIYDEANLWIRSAIAIAMTLISVIVCHWPM